MIVLNMIPRKSNVNINSVTEYLDNFPKEKKKIDTFLHSLESEVKANPQQAKKLTKLMSGMSSMLIATLFTTIAPQVSGLQIDPELRQMFFIAMAAVAALAIVIAAITGMLAGVWKMFPFIKSKLGNADDWTISILKGLSQVLATPIIIGAIVVLFSLLFGKLTFFTPVTEAVNYLLH